MGVYFCMNHCSPIRRVYVKFDFGAFAKILGENPNWVKIGEKYEKLYKKI